MLARAVRDRRGVETRLHWPGLWTWSSKKTRTGRAPALAAADLPALRQPALDAAKTDKSVEDAVRSMLLRAAISNNLAITTKVPSQRWTHLRGAVSVTFRLASAASGSGRPAARAFAKMA